MTNDIVEAKELMQVSDSLYKGVTEIIDNARQEVVVYVNKHSDMMFWHIGRYINEDMGYKQYSAYGNKILATLSQTLSQINNGSLINSIVQYLSPKNMVIISKTGQQGVIVLNKNI